ncbi:MAG: alpha-1,2-fucosyltransferase [Desulfobaccales bacterium]
MVVARIKGGLGNQLFIYAAARRLSLKNNVPLKLDIMSGFQRDYFQRKYRLHHFNIKGEVASRHRSFDGIFGRVRRQILKKMAKFTKFEKRRYITQEFPGFDPRLLDFKVNGIAYLDGIWASEKYFKDIEGVIRDDLKMVAGHDSRDLALAAKIQSGNSIGIHVRRLRELPGNGEAEPNPSSPALTVDYYKRGIDIIAGKVADPVFYCFGDHPQWLSENIKMDFPLVVVNHNKDEKDYEDLWLMSLCKHFIIANSTFSWWGAWLSDHHDKIVITPGGNNDSTIPGMEIFHRDAILSGWLKI